MRVSGTATPAASEGVCDRFEAQRDVDSDGDQEADGRYDHHRQEQNVLDENLPTFR